MSHRSGIHFIAEVPDGSKLVSIKGRVYLAHADHRLREVTSDGLIEDKVINPPDFRLRIFGKTIFEGWA